MPKIIKNTIPHILISLFVAPITLLAFTWVGSEFMTNRDIKISMPHLEQKLDTIISTQSKYMRMVIQNKTDISYIKGSIK